jgi:hypothetical protein
MTNYKWKKVKYVKFHFIPDVVSAYFKGYY